MLQRNGPLPSTQPSFEYRRCLLTENPKAAHAAEVVFIQPTASLVV